VRYERSDCGADSRRLLKDSREPVYAPLLLMMAGRDVSSDPTDAEKGNTEEQEPGWLRQSKPVTPCLGNSNHRQ
jgi:hypothetical protein